MERTDDPLAEARRLGRLEGERFDARLRRRERQERDDRLTRLAWTVEDGGDAPEPPAASGEVWRLRRDVERLAAFHDAVVRSRGWRLVQVLRRLFGRAG
jgi:hypothetical protein